MPRKQFYKGFFITFLIAGAINLLALQWTPLHPYMDIALIILLFFSGLSLLVYYLGDYLAKQKNKSLFTFHSMFLVLFKLVAAILIIWGYESIIQPTDKYYVLLFVLTYIIFTVFEVRVMMQLSKVKAQ